MNETEPIVVSRSIIVPAPIERAFTVFIERFDEIKPHEHTVLATPVERTVFEPFVGGNIYDRAIDGTECRWARVLVYEPPTRVVFTWDIGPTWQLETDPERSSEVEVRWIAESADRTRLELVHRNLDRHGPGWQSVRDGVDGADGWPVYLTNYAAIFSID